MATADERAKKHLAAWLAKRFLVRFHFSLILGFAVAAGLLATKGFLALGLDTMHWRWPLALLVAYAAFLFGVRLWLGYIGLGRYLDRKDDSGIEIPDLSFSGGGGGSRSGSGVGDALLDGVGRVNPGGGQFGGGGASGDFALGAVDGGGNGGLLPKVDLPDVGVDADEGCLPILALLLILALLAVVLGLGVYVIWQAPALLAEAAFEGALAAGLVKPFRRIEDPGWIGGAVRASWMPFLAVFVIALAIAGLAEAFAPEARTLPEAVKILSR